MSLKNSIKENRKIGSMLLCALWSSVLFLGCGVPQSEECEQYIECRRWYEAVFNRPEKQLNIYQEEGVCWENEQLAEDCSETCTLETEQLLDKLIDAQETIGPCEMDS